MKKICLSMLCFVMILSPVAFAAETADEMKTYLSDMNKIVVTIEMTMRNLGGSILPVKNAIEQFAGAIEKFEALKPSLTFSKEHYSMLDSFKTIRNGLELLSTGDRDKANEIVKKGAALLKESAMNMKKIAEEKGLIPVKPAVPVL